VWRKCWVGGVALPDGVKKHEKERERERKKISKVKQNQ